MKLSNRKWLRVSSIIMNSGFDDASMMVDSIYDSVSTIAILNMR